MKVILVTILLMMLPGLRGQQESGFINGFCVQPEFDVYPNPAKGYFTVQLDELAGLDNLQIIICDLTGNIIFSGFAEYDKPCLIIDFTSHPDGVYIVQLQSPNIFASKRIVVNKSN